MGLSWHQGPLAPGSFGRFLIPTSARTAAVRRAAAPAHGVRFADSWIAGKGGYSREPIGAYITSGDRVAERLRFDGSLLRATHATGVVAGSACGIRHFYHG
jgi:hypothetical protein